MIEIVDTQRCIECNICVEVCPRDVFDSVADSIPVIARKNDCQTCFLCELYCPTDALYVSPYAEQDEAVQSEPLIEAGLMGSFSRNMGWRRGKAAGTDQDPTRRIRLRNAGGGG
jgi:NAD-dependent dihydropyrimidine dehydrogenase PreA subunit